MAWNPDFVGFILQKMSVYYWVLEEVMGARPNLKPPHVEESTLFGVIGALSPSYEVTCMTPLLTFPII